MDILPETSDALSLSPVGMTYVYLFTMCIMLAVLARKMKGAAVNSRWRLNLRVLQAVYSNPAIKEQIEKELGEPLGYVPPVPKAALRFMGAKVAETKRMLAESRGKRRDVVILLVLLIIFAPGLVLPACIFLALFRIRTIHLSTAEEEEAECECCCCGVSTTDVKNGKVTSEQACCNCCQGLGVCKPSCASCCGSGDAKDSTGSDGCCCCCGSDCCCCGAKDNKACSATSSSDSCCCCGTDCCCCGSDCSCCGTDCCCCGPAEPLLKNHEKDAVHEGVALDIV